MFLEHSKSAVSSKSNVKLYVFIVRIFSVPIDEFGQKYPDIYQRLETVRKYRNQVIHGQFRTNEASDEYEEINELPPFRLIELIELISSVLDLVEWEYISLTSTKQKD